MAVGLALHDLACVRGGRQVFSELSFEAPPGALVQVVGRNGIGKSSLLRLLAGLAPAASGAIELDGETADSGGEHRSRVLYVGHRNAVKPWLTVRENLAFWLRWRAGCATDDDTIFAALGGAGLTHLADLPAAYLSFGQARRLALSLLWVDPAALILLDEPAVGLDTAAAGRLMEAILTACGRGAIVIVATHDRLPAATLTLDMAPFGPLRTALS